MLTLAVVLLDTFQPQSRFRSLQSCFTSTATLPTITSIKRGAQGGHLDLLTAPELWTFPTLSAPNIPPPPPPPPPTNRTVSVNVNASSRPVGRGALHCHDRGGGGRGERNPPPPPPHTHTKWGPNWRFLKTMANWQVRCCPYSATAIELTCFSKWTWCLTSTETISNVFQQPLSCILPIIIMLIILRLRRDRKNKQAEELILNSTSTQAS